MYEAIAPESTRRARCLSLRLTLARRQWHSALVAWWNFCRGPCEFAAWRLRLTCDRLLPGVLVSLGPEGSLPDNRKPEVDVRRAMSLSFVQPERDYCCCSWISNSDVRSSTGQTTGMPRKPKLTNSCLVLRRYLLVTGGMLDRLLSLCQEIDLS